MPKEDKKKKKWHRECHEKENLIEGLNIISGLIKNSTTYLYWNLYGS